MAGDRGALRIAHDDNVIAGGGLRHDRVVQYRDALLDRLAEGFVVEAGDAARTVPAYADSPAV